MAFVAVPHYLPPFLRTCAALDDEQMLFFWYLVAAGVHSTANANSLKLDVAADHAKRITCYDAHRECNVTVDCVKPLAQRAQDELAIQVKCQASLLSCLIRMWGLGFPFPTGTEPAALRLDHAILRIRWALKAATQGDIAHDYRTVGNHSGLTATHANKQRSKSRAPQSDNAAVVHCHWSRPQMG